MAQEITITASLKAAKGSLNVKKDTITLRVDMASAYSTDQVQTIGTTQEILVVQAEIATPGWALFRNLDATNYLELGVFISAVFTPFAKLKPGEVALLPLSATPIYAKANTAPCDLNYCILAR